MKEASWEECVEYNSAKKVSPNLERADSLRGVAEERIGIIKEITLKNCNFVFEDYYTSLLELLQALIIQRGYKILNHICLGYFLRDVLFLGVSSFCPLERNLHLSHFTVCILPTCNFNP